MIPFGNTVKNVAISLFTASGVLSYSCTNSVTTPPGLRCVFAASKNSLVYSVAAPFTHGSSGSEVIASNFSFDVSRKCRASSILTRTFGLSMTW